MRNRNRRRIFPKMYGYGRGICWYWTNVPIPKDTRKEILEEELESLRKRLRVIEKELNSI